MGAYCAVILSIGFDIGKYEGDKENEIINLSLQEFEKLENNLVEKSLKQLISNFLSLHNKEFLDIMRFICLSDCHKLIYWIKENIKSDINLIIKLLNLSMCRSIMTSDDNYITYSYLPDMLTKAIYPMNWDNLIKDYIKSNEFINSDKDIQRALIIYFMQKTLSRDYGGFMDKQIDDFYNNNIKNDKA